MSDDTITIVLVRKEETRREILDAAAGKTSPVQSHSVRVMNSVADVARVFTRTNVAILETIRNAGHISLEDAAKRLGYSDASAFVLRTMDGVDGLGAGLNLFLDFMPLPDGTPGVKVSFTKLLLDLDL